MNGNTRDLLKKVEQIGWTLDGHTDGGHLRLIHTSGATYITPATPSDWRGVKNCIATLERLGGQKLPRVNRGRGKSKAKKEDAQVEASRRRYAAQAEAEREKDRVRRLAEHARATAAMQAAAEEKRLRDIEQLMRPGW